MNVSKKSSSNARRKERKPSKTAISFKKIIAANSNATFAISTNSWNLIAPTKTKNFDRPPVARLSFGSHNMAHLPKSPSLNELPRL